MSSIFLTIGDGSAPIAVDDDPNTTEPDASRTFSSSITPSLLQGMESLYYVAEGLSVDPNNPDLAYLKFWVYVPELGAWQTVSIPANAVAILGLNDPPLQRLPLYDPLPRNLKVFLQVVSNDPTDPMISDGVRKISIGAYEALA